jgi:hypothetical protein
LVRDERCIGSVLADDVRVRVHFDEVGWPCADFERIRNAKVPPVHSLIVRVRHDRGGRGIPVRLPLGPANCLVKTSRANQYDALLHHGRGRIEISIGGAWTTDRSRAVEGFDSVPSRRGHR